MEKSSLAPTAGTEFYGSGTTLPAGWQWAVHGTGTPSVSLNGGWLTIDNAQVYTSDPSLYAPGRAIEFVANFGGGQFQAGGFAVNAITLLGRYLTLPMMPLRSLIGRVVNCYRYSWKLGRYTSSLQDRMDRDEYQILY